MFTFRVGNETGRFDLEEEKEVKEKTPFASRKKKSQFLGGGGACAVPVCETSNMEMFLR